MFVLIDTNVLVRSAQPSSPSHALAIDSQAQLKLRGDQPCMVAQNLVEFRAVATRPANVNGLGMSEADADKEIARLKSLYPLFADDQRILTEWESLVRTFGAMGKQNHDARIAATMSVHGIPAILTFIKSDFVRYPALLVIEPADFASTTP